MAPAAVPAPAPTAEFAGADGGDAGHTATATALSATLPSRPHTAAAPRPGLAATTALKPPASRASTSAAAHASVASAAAPAGRRVSAPSHGGGGSGGGGASSGAAAPWIGRDYALYDGAPRGRELRLARFNKGKWIITSDAVTGSGAARTVQGLLQDTADEWRAANIASPTLLADMFVTGDTAAGKVEAAVAWLAHAIAVGEGETAALANSDLVLKYVAVLLLDVREKSSLISGAQAVLDALLSAVSKRGLHLHRAEADIIMPTMCEKVSHS